MSFLSIPRDSTWLRNSFLSSSGFPADRERYRKSNGWLKFMDTTLGGNTAINAPYQFCRYADIKERRLLPDIGKGMGRWYSQHIDDWGHNIHFRMGIPAFSGVLPFALKAINGPAARYVATGRIPGYFSDLGRVAGYIISAAFWEITLLSMFINTIIDLTHSRFYYLKPTMFQYWRVVQTLVNTLSANLGIGIQAERNGANNLKGIDVTIDDARKALPDTFRKPFVGADSDIGIDIHAVACRAQALSIRHHEHMIRVMSNLGTNMDANTLAKMVEQGMMSSPVNTGNNKGHLNPNLTNKSLFAYERSFSGLKAFQPNVDENTRGKEASEILSTISKKAGEDAPKNESGLTKWFRETVDSFSNVFRGEDRNGFATSLLAELRDGSQWCSFRVESAADSVSENFSNSAESSELQSIFNNISQSARGFMFNLGNGATGIKPIDNAIQGVMNGIGDMFIDGAATTCQFINPIIGLMYGAQIEIPKRYSGSKHNLPTTNFDIELKAGYGNVMSYFQDILIPLCMLLAMALPRGTGPQSYGSPFYVQYYSKGRSQVRLGLVSSLSITRGTGNAPWHKNGWPMGVKVSMTIEDMSETMFTPIAQGIKIEGAGASILGSPVDENSMGDYLAVLSALGMNEQEYFLPRLKRRFNNLIADFNSWTSPQRWMSMGVNSTLGSAFAMTTAATDVRR